MIASMADDHFNKDDDDSHPVDVELMEIASTTEIEISEHTDLPLSSFSAEHHLLQDDQQLLKEEIKDDDAYDSDMSSKNPGKRLLLKDWLTKKLDNEEMPDILSWVNKSEGLFRIKWLHKATDSWQMGADGVLFKEWCVYTGKYDPKSENPRRWKANFRCALNSLPDVVIEPSLCVRKGKDAYRVFRMLPEKIPEKVREKQESSRKRRREKRESMRRAMESKIEARLNDGITIPSSLFLSQNKKSMTTKRFRPQGSNVTIGTTTASSTTATKSAAAVLNGMDALCTAAAMMADKPSEDTEQEETTAAISTVLPLVTAVSAPLAGDIVTYYRPVGPIQIINKDGTPTVLTSPILANNVSSPTKQTQAAAIQGAVPLYRSVTPVKGVTTPNTVTSTPGSVLLNVRIAQPSSGINLPTTKLVQQGITIPGFGQGLCLQPVTTPAVTSQKPQTNTYIIPKALIQKQAVSSSQPARVITIKTTAPISIGETTLSPSLEGALPTTPKPIVQKNSKATSLSSTTEIKLQPDMIEYYTLKANLANVDYSNLRFQPCKNTQYIRFIRIYDSDKPSVEVSVSVYPDYTYSIIVHNRNLPASHEIFKSFGKTIKSVAQLSTLLQRLQDYVTCIGNPEDMPHQQYSDYSSFCNAYQEPDFGAKNQVLRYHSTIRSNSCQLLVKLSPDISSLEVEEAKDRLRCDECAKIRTQVLSMKGLFCLLDGSKVPDTEYARKRRLHLLQEYTTKEVLATRIDTLETQIKQLRQFIPTEIHEVDIGCNMPDDGTVVQDSSAGFIDSICESTECTVVSEIPVNQSQTDSMGGVVTTIGSRLYHINPNSSDMILVTEANSTESLLDELSNSTLSN